ncbi:LEA domain protein [Aspergillus fijiensis CBS 313.89]|uniref:LEA domain protein n=1 Tax=Aspergillus fijiensis CBS 313.89 TaxID=1448319 RepID=A0A8G1RET9_9EURO|nr:LEA domain protein [Aspergillus fijiensis CBS 313.89]RAK71443.1 LEA domain protein [Aspergillus fijiensis CBS 313.89]
MEDWDISKPLASLPSINLTRLGPGISFLLPLSRRGHGPGLILLVPNTDHSLDIIDGVPSPLIKWAEEGYSVVEVQEQALAGGGHDAFTIALDALVASKDCDNGKIGLIVYDPQLWTSVATTIPGIPSIVAIVMYGEAGSKLPSACTPAAQPILCHLAGTRPKTQSRQTRQPSREYYYPTAKSFLFATPFADDFLYGPESISHTRSLSFLKPLMAGPYFDLEAIWDEHTFYEFTDRSVEHTMSTMVAQPYVNHVPTLTGGIGRESLTHFYRHNFIFNNSADTETELISRSLGIDRVIDEFIFKFTHDRELDWLLPGVPPTQKRAAIPFTAIVNIRGDRLYHEHISWDQGTVLAQLGLIPDYLPFPCPLPDGRRVEYRVPVCGIATAEKLRDHTAVPSNQLFEYKVREYMEEP